MPFRYDKDPMYRHGRNHTDDPSKVDKCMVAVVRRMHLCAIHGRGLTYRAFCNGTMTADAFEQAYNNLKAVIFKHTKSLVQVGRLGEVVSIVIDAKTLQQLRAVRALPATVPGISVTLAMAASAAGELAN